MENIKVHQENHIGILSISRPAQLNALNRNTLAEIGTQLDIWREDDAIRVVIITGEGNKAFAAGADIKELSECDVLAGTELSRFGQVNVFDKIEYYPKVVIAAVNGYALGGGCELAMACHLRIASNNAQFGQPETNLGLIPGYGGTQRLPQLIGKSRAYQMLLTGASISAATALEYGLVSALSAADTLMEDCQKLAAEIASKSPLVNQKIIHCMNAYYDEEGRDGYEEEIKNFGACFGTEDASTGIEAFLQKQKPKFIGR